MSAPGVITLGLTRTPSEVLLFGFTSAAVVQGGGLVTLGLGLTPSRVLLHGLSPQVDSEWDIAAPMDLPALAGTLTLAGDLTFSSGSTPTIQSGGGAIVGGKKKRRVGLNYERLRIEQEDALVVDVITALVAAGVI